MTRPREEVQQLWVRQKKRVRRSVQVQTNYSAAYFAAYCCFEGADRTEKPEGSTFFPTPIQQRPAS